MSLRNTVLAAIVGALLVWSPTHLSAQQRGPDRGPAAAAQEAGSDRSRGQRAGESLPAGILRAFADAELPPGIRRVFGLDEEEPAPEPPVTEPVVDAEPPTDADCGTDIVFVDGMFVEVDCHGEPVS